MKLPSKASIGQSVVGKFNELIDFVRSIRPLGGRGIRVTQTSGGVSIGLGAHGADHAAGGRDEIGFEKLVITLPGSPPKTITLDPSAADFLGGRILSVADDGAATAWRTMLDLLDGLDGFAADKALTVNAAGDGLEWGDASGGVQEDSATAIQSGKLVLGATNAKTIMGTLIGINLHGSAYAGYSDSDVPTDARAAAIADSRFNAQGGVQANTFQAGGELCFWDDAALRIVGGVTLKDQIASEFNFAALVGGYWLLVYNYSTGNQTAMPIWEVLAGESGFAADKVLAANSAGDGLEWVAAPEAVPSGTGQYKVLQLNGSNEPVWDYVRAH